MYALSTPSPQQHQPPRPMLRSLLLHWMVGLFAAMLLMLAGFAAHATPPAGTVINNQASASFTDSGGVTRTVLSNTVQTTVLQVAALTLTANGGALTGTLNGTPGSIVYFPHILTNTGNGTDTFTLTAPGPGVGFPMTVQIFADNGSGAPTGPAITVSPALLANGVFRFVVAATLPGSATAGQTNAITVTATSVATPAVNRVNTDTTTVVTGANITLNKAISASSGAPGSGPYTYTITYNNIGNSTATAVAITDILPAGMLYVAGSSRWSVSGGTALSDSGGSTGTAPNTITSTYTAGTTTLLFTLNQVVAGGSGTLTFTVNVPALTAAGVRNNIATTSYTSGGATLTASSNTVPFTVTAAAGVTLTPPAPVTTAGSGSVVTFSNTLQNTGTATDTFNMSILAGSTFPAGTTFQLFRPDGITLLTDTNTDGIIDTGPVAAGVTIQVILRATLPANAPASGTAVTVTKRATSVNTPAIFASAIDTLNAVTASSVNLTNNIVSPPAGTLGDGITTAGEATPQQTNTVNSGAATTFTLVVRNGGNASDTYDLGASTTANFSATTLPAGWGVTFRVATGPGAAPTTASCSSTGATVVNTGSIAVGANAVFCAEVSVPAGFTPGDVSLYFRALSPSSASFDILHDRVTVNAVRSLTITPNGTNQTTPGGTVVYPHTLTNTGNANEGNGTLSTVTLGLANNQPGWTSTVHFDANGNGVIDAGENPITAISGGLAPGATMALLVRVNAAAAATAGQVNITTLTVTTANGTYVTTVPAVVSATDTTTIVSGNLQLVKEQALDANCDGTPDTAYAQTAISALPNGCVMYRITATNVGGTNATNVVVSDAPPTFTRISTLAIATAPATMTGGTSPALDATTGLSTGSFTLTPGQVGVVTFGVRIDN